jgi:hypothetical protein
MRKTFILSGPYEHLPWSAKSFISIVIAATVIKEWIYEGDIPHRSMDCGLIMVRNDKDGYLHDLSSVIAPLRLDTDYECLSWIIFKVFGSRCHRGPVSIHVSTSCIQK